MAIQSLTEAQGPQVGQLIEAGAGIAEDCAKPARHVEVVFEGKTVACRIAGLAAVGR